MQTKYESFLELEETLQKALRQANTIANEVYTSIDCANKSTSPERIKKRGPILTDFENYVKKQLNIDPKKPDEEIDPSSIKVLDEAMALFSQKIKLANCDQIASIILKRLAEEIDWPSHAGPYKFEYEFAKCFCKDIDHCVVRLSIAMKMKNSKSADYYCCVIDPWVVMEYKDEKKTDVKEFIIALSKYSLGSELKPWNVFTASGKNISADYRKQFSESTLEDIKTWVETFYEDNAQDTYYYSKSTRFFANNKLGEDDLDNSFTAEEVDNEDLKKSI